MKFSLFNRLLSIILLVGTALLLRQAIIKQSPIVQNNHSRGSEIPKILSQTVKTALGNRSYEEILRIAYRPLGLEVNPDVWNGNKVYPFLPLITTKRKTCDEIFERWLRHNDKPVLKGPPVEEIPEEYYNKFTLGNLTKVGDWYRKKDNKNMRPIAFTAKDFSDREALVKLAIKNGVWDGPYESDGMNLIQSMRENPPRGSGLIIGSISPWVEAVALHFGASELLTAEYSKLLIEHDKVSYIHPVELAKNWRKYAGFDFVASFSSIEHSGLGRYGDRVDPFGDYWEFQKIRCLVKPGGTFYVGFPMGPDRLWWNAHRVYGPIRWPIVAADWDVVGLSPEEFQNIAAERRGNQPVIRLQKPKNQGFLVES